MLIAWCAHKLGWTKFVAKIGEENKKSIALFGKKMGFKIVRRIKAFEEVHLELEWGGSDCEVFEKVWKSCKVEDRAQSSPQRTSS